MLKKILKATRERVALEQKACPSDRIEKMISDFEIPDFMEALEKPFFIAEIKYSSPSEGSFGAAKDHLSLAEIYIDSQAEAISILTEPQFFGGSLGNLRTVRQRHSKARLLMKDFVVSPYQVLQARAHGANAVLLIADILSLSQLQKLVSLGESLGLSSLVEVHEKKNLKKAYQSGSQIIGINNRNLKTMRVSLQHSMDLAPEFSSEFIHVSESGIQNSQQVQGLLDCGFSGFLVGTHLMKSSDPGQSLKSLRPL